MTLLYEGKAKSVYETDDKNVLSIEYKDEVTAGNGEKHDFIPGKGHLTILFQLLFLKDSMLLASLPTL